MTSETRFWPGLLGAAALMIGLSACSKTSDGGASAPATPPTPAATVTLAANPSSFTVGASTTLSWTTTNAFACTASGGWSGNKATSGSETQTPGAAGTVTYTLTCAGTGGSGNATATVTVNAPPVPTVALSAAPASVVIGSASTLTWSSTNATACTASGDWLGSRPTSGTQAVTPAAVGTLNYTLTCTGPGGSAAATSTVTVTPPPRAQLTIRGRVIDGGNTFTGQATDGAIVNAAVTVTVGTQTFTGTADSTGNYSIPLDIARSDIGQFVSIAASGNVNHRTSTTPVGPANPQANAAAGAPVVQFLSLLGTFSTLQTAAGSDGVLTRSENFGVNVTNLTTASAVLAIAANGGTMPTTDAALAAAQMASDPGNVLNLAIVTALVVDRDVPLPTGIATTLDLLNNVAVRNQFVYDQSNAAGPNANNGILFRATSEDLLADPEVTTQITAATLPRTVYTDQLATTPEQDLFVNGGGIATRYDFNPDGSGSFGTFLQYSSSMQWTINGSGDIVIQFGTNPSYNSTIIVANGAAGQTLIPCRYETVGVTVHPISSTAAIEHVDSRQTCSDSQYNYTNSTDTTVLFVTSAQLAASAGTVSTADVVGRTMTLQILDVPNFNGSIDRTPMKDDLVTFNANGTGSARLLGLSLNWAINAGVLEVSYSNGVTVRYRKARSLFPGGAIWLAEFSYANALYADNSVVYLSDGTLTFNAATFPGVYYQHGFGAAYDDLTSAYYTGTPLPLALVDLLKGFALEFFNTGRAQNDFEYLDQDANGNFVRGLDSGGFGVWGLHSDGSLSYQRYIRRSGSGGSASCTFDSTDSGCSLTDNRELFPVSSSGTRRIWVERRTLSRDSTPINSQSPIQQPARFYDYAPNGDYQINPTPPAPVRGANGSAGVRAASPAKANTKAKSPSRASINRLNAAN